jgi:hypothetical protein
MKKLKSETARIARKFRVTERTVRAWAREKAPLHDENKLATWLAGRRQPPRTTLTSRAAPVKKSVPHDANAHGTGAAAALRRLEQSELADYKRLVSALTSGDALEIRIARDAWHKTGDALRHYDFRVAQDRRASGELVPRAEVERMVHAFGTAVRYSLLGLLDLPGHLVGLKEPHDVAQVLYAAVNNAGASAGAALKLAHPPLPDWMAKVLAATMDYGFGAERFDEFTAKLAESLRITVAAYAANARERLDKRHAAEAKWRACTDPVEKSRIWHEEYNPLSYGL